MDDDRSVGTLIQLRDPEEYSYSENAGLATGYISLERDEAFAPAGSYFKVFASSSYKLQASSGVVCLLNANQPQDKTELLQFAASGSGNLSLPPEGILEWRWIGKAGPDPVFSGQEVRLASAATGLLEVAYRVLFDRWRLSGAKEDSLVAGTCDGATASLLFEAEDGPKECELQVVDHCTGEPVYNATVVVDGQTYRSDARGRVYLGVLAKGEHSLVMDKDGYKHSRADGLDNDGFVL